MKRVLFILILFSSVSITTEIDSFSIRNTELKDSTIYLNNLMNSYIQESIAEANTWGYCDNESFINNLHNRIGGFFWTTFENTISSSSVIPWVTTCLEDSIYQDFSFFYAPALYLASLGPVLRLGNYFIGSDKFGHFISTGYDYYKAYKNNQDSLEHALEFGEYSESGYFGRQTTGIYSWADLVANYHGFKYFWSKLIGNNSSFYIICKNNKYYQARIFDWTTHINAGWDEGINCNSYKNKILEEQVEKRLSLLNLSCPVAPQECKELINLYGDLAPRLVSPICFGN